MYRMSQLSGLGDYWLVGFDTFQTELSRISEAF
jgi:hypothetical protein